MKILLTGADGQLGRSLISSQPEHLAGQTVHLVPCRREDLDLTDLGACRALVECHRPDWLLNAAAYTAVDRAEEEKALAQRVNGDAPGVLAEALAFTSGRLLQISTDFVFDGSQGTPYRVDQPQAPLGVYGASKAVGERAVRSQLGDRAVVMRTSWLYGPQGRNFLHTMLRRHREQPELSVVADQVGCPTNSLGLAHACWRLIECGGQGQSLLPVMHWSDSGVASWYDFAVAIGELAQAAGLLEAPARVVPISTAAYPTPARRPSYSLLDCTGTREVLACHPPHWRHALRVVLAEMVDRFGK